MKVLSIMVLALSMCLAPSLASAHNGGKGYGFFWNHKSPTFLCGGHKCKAMKFSYVKTRDHKNGYKDDYDSDDDMDDNDSDNGTGTDTGNGGMDNGGTDGNNGQPTVVPEINAGGTSMALVLIGGLLMVLRERRRQSTKA